MINITDFEEINVITVCNTCGEKTKKSINIEFSFIEEDIGIILCKNCAKELINEMNNYIN